MSQRPDYKRVSKALVHLAQMMERASAHEERLTRENELLKAAVRDAEISDRSADEWSKEHAEAIRLAEGS